MDHPDEVNENEENLDQDEKVLEKDDISPDISRDVKTLQQKAILK